MEKTINKINWEGPIQVAIVAGIILGANLPFFFMHRTDLKTIEAENRSFREKYEAENRDFRERWAQETKEFHGRLCNIEEKRAK